MNFDFFDRRSAERFAELLDESTGGRRHHSRGPADEQLAELVAIGSSLSAARPGARVEPEFRTGLRAMLVATAERDGIGHTARAADTEPEPAAVARTGRLRHGLLGHGGRIRARGAIVIGVAAGALAVSGISAASENASPGDALYGVKRSTERAQLAMAGSDVTRGQLSLDFARTRLAEAVAMPGNDAGFGGVLDDMDADTRKGVKLLTTSAVARKDSKPLSTIDTFAEQQRRTLTPSLSRLSATNQERALTSIGLLDSVNKRAESLRTGLGCDNAVSAGADKLGPKLKGCAAGDETDAQAPPSRSSGQNDKQKPRTAGQDDVKAPRASDPAVAPTTSTGARRPAQQRTPSQTPDLPLGGTPLQASPSADDTFQQQQQQQQELPADEEDDGLGGLLGGIFGND
ncbi:DUF5667 domain-containing protein [Paractinoplanes hotanensis]|uniref:DUF5667 domain-containing protein n=1 Tax=Paractinoplanes hotanensis TaxID=2906497 RepID=A0ABT0XTX7_9ACTN|nr:DUF5667 domain-containing protein [Actinoplanes hotanensis]MCM4077187.1 DUF5667 domain-containing protein [Actinoplanes hotanensis]